MKKLICLLICSACLAVTTYGCNNFFYAVDKEGRVREIEAYMQSGFDQNFDTQRNAGMLRAIVTQLKKERNYIKIFLLFF